MITLLVIYLIKKKKKKRIEIENAKLCPYKIEK